MRDIKCSNENLFRDRDERERPKCWINSVENGKGSTDFFKKTFFSFRSTRFSGKANGVCSNVFSFGLFLRSDECVCASTEPMSRAVMPLMHFAEAESWKCEKPRMWWLVMNAKAHFIIPVNVNDLPKCLSSYYIRACVLSHKNVFNDGQYITRSKPWRCGDRLLDINRTRLSCYCFHIIQSEMFKRDGDSNRSMIESVAATPSKWAIKRFCYVFRCFLFYRSICIDVQTLNASI